MHYCLAGFDFNLGNVNIHNRKSKAELCYTAIDVVSFFCYKHKFLTLFCSCDKEVNLRPQDCFLS